MVNGVGPVGRLGDRAHEHCRADRLTRPAAAAARRRYSKRLTAQPVTDGRLEAAQVEAEVLDLDLQPSTSTDAGSEPSAASQSGAAQLILRTSLIASVDS